MCVCGEEYTFLSKEDDNPEYYSQVGILCKKCGEAVFELLPVN